MFWKAGSKLPLYMGTATTHVTGSVAKDLLYILITHPARTSVKQVISPSMSTTPILEVKSDNTATSLSPGSIKQVMKVRIRVSSRWCSLVRSNPSLSFSQCHPTSQRRPIRSSCAPCSTRTSQPEPSRSPITTAPAALPRRGARVRCCRLLSLNAIFSTRVLAPKRPTP